MKLPVLNAEGKELRSMEVDDSVFGIVPNEAVLHQAFVTQRNNQRAGTAQTKTRGQVQGSTRKTRMQKYTGRARHGGIRAPIYVGGGVAFGPKPRDFGLSINKKMRRLAIRSALSGKVADGELVVIDQLTFSAPRTKEVLRILRNVGIERSALIVTAQSDRTVLASARNIQKTKVLPAPYLNVADMLNHRHLLMTEEAVKMAEGLWGQKPPPPQADGRKKPAKAEAAAAPVAEAPKRRRAKAEAEAPPAPEAEVKPRTSRAAKPAAEKPAAKAKPKAPRAPRASKPAAEAATAGAEKPKRPTRRAKPAAEASVEEAPKPRRRTKKSDEGES
jgi:large subunit ribosomal protein L4